MKKKFLALVLCLSLLLVQFSTVLVSAEVDTAALYDATTATYTVKSADELIAVFAEINSAEANYGRNITLTADIDLTGKTVTPLATYSGTFDGGNKTIKGLTLTSEADHVALIVNGTGCTVKNLTLDGAVITGSKNAAALIGISGNKTVGETKVASTVSNCTVINSVITAVGGTVGGIVGTTDADAAITVEKCSVIDSYLATTHIVVGGIVGISYNVATITDCTVDLDASKVITIGDATYAPAIISAHNKASGPDGHAAGIVGQPKKAVTIDGCSVYADISSKKYAGGITGQAAGGATVTNCIVVANIKATNYGGGIIAGESGTNTYTITNCFTAGDYQITSNPAGGILGYSSGDTWNVTNCVSIATFSAAKGGASIFGSTKKCVYNVKDCVGSSAFFGDFTVDDDTTITESGSKIIGTETAMVKKLNYSNGKKLTINETVYTEASDPTAAAAVAAFKATAVAEADLLALVAEVFAVADDPATEGVDEKALADAFIKEVQAAILCSIVADLYDAATNTYTVSTADELIDVINAINAGYADRNITLAADIDLTGKTYTPLVAYAGTFDGGNKTIQGLRLISESNTKVGLISTAANGCVVKNLTIDDAIIHTGGATAGLIIAQFNIAGKATIESCTVQNSVVVGGSTNIGGVVGYMASSDNCVLNLIDTTVINTIVDGQKQVGGLVGGATKGTINFEGCSIVDSYVVASNGTQQVGGLLGRAEGKAFTFADCLVDLDPAVTLTKSFKDAKGGDVTYKVSPAVESEQHHAGGIVGYSKQNMTFVDCVVNGTVIAAGKGAGGYVGTIDADKLAIHMTRCAADVAVQSKGNSASTGTGGLVGYTKSAVIATDCIVAGTIVDIGQGQAGGVIGYSTANSTLTNIVSMTTSTAASGKQNEWDASEKSEMTNCVDQGEKTNLEFIATLDAMFAKADDPATEGVDEKAIADAFIADAKTVATAHTLKVLGYQTKDAGNDTYDIRFVAYIDSEKYGDAGFEITANIGGEEKTAIYSAKAVYQEIYQTIGDETTVLTIEKLGNYTDGYILAVKVTGVPKTVTEFSVTPYVKTVGTGELFKGLSGTASVVFPAN